MLGRYLEDAGLRFAARHDIRSGRAALRAEPLRPADPGRDAPRRRRALLLPRAARVGLAPDRDADRAGDEADRSSASSSARTTTSQAVQPARAARARARGAAARGAVRRTRAEVRASGASRSTAARASCGSTARSARSPATSSTCSSRSPRARARALARRADGARARPRARGVRPQHRRARLAHPRRDRGRPQAPAAPPDRARRRLRVRGAARTRTARREAALPAHLPGLPRDAGRAARGELAAFWWHGAGPRRGRNLLRATSTLVEAALPAADAPAEDARRLLEARLADSLRGDLALFDADAARSSRAPAAPCRGPSRTSAAATGSTTAADLPRRRCGSTTAAPSSRGCRPRAAERSRSSRASASSGSRSRRRVARRARLTRRLERLERASRRSAPATSRRASTSRARTRWRASPAASTAPPSASRRSSARSARSSRAPPTSCARRSRGCASPPSSRPSAARPSSARDGPRRRAPRRGRRGAARREPARAWRRRATTRVDLLALAAEEAARAGGEARGRPVALRGDARSLRHLLRNLVENARRHAPGAPVEIEVAREGGERVVRVLDRGPGLAPDERERVFEPFGRGEGASARAPGSASRSCG